MSINEETIDATLGADGQLQLSQPSQVPPCPVQVTIRSMAAPPKRGLADVLRELAAEQRVRGFSGRTAEELAAIDEARQMDDEQRDQELDSARRSTRGGS